jgi:hypothetical protein
MARANPARSPYSATRHLLRNLGNARELRRNPLARMQFAGRSADETLRAVAGRVDSALHAIASTRHIAILMRVDRQRHDPRRVATDLGLSTRQFYRERRLAHDSFFAAYRAGEYAAATVESDLSRPVLARAASLADSGETESAKAILDDVLRSGVSETVACEALLCLAETEAWAHRLDRARSHLNACERLCAQLDADRDAALADRAAADALLLRWFCDGPGSVARERNGGRMRSGSRVLLVRAAAVLRNGESLQASSLLSELVNLGHRESAPEFAVDVLTLQAELADFTAANPFLSEDLFARAATLAASSGLRGRELYARHQLALTRWAHSRSAEDRRAYRELVDAVDRSLSPRLRSYLTFSAADVELAIGHPRRALQTARAAASVSTNHYESFSAHGLAAGALLRLGRVGDAATQAELAADGARAEGHARVLSLAQRICAQAYFAQGNRGAARAAIEESIEYARRFSTPHVLAQAQALWGRIAGRS